MPLLTFTPATVLSSGAALYSGADPTTDALGTDETPALWPTDGLVSSAEIEITATTAPGYDGGLLLALFDIDDREPVLGSTTLASGVWSGDPGELVEFFDGEAWALDKFGGWRTDYATFPSDSTAASNMFSTGVGASMGPSFEVSFKIRRANWSTSTNNCIYHDSWGAFGYLRCTTTGVSFVAPNNATAEVPYSTLGAVNGQWLEATMTWDNTNKLRWWVGGTLVATYTPAWTSAAAAANWRFGNGTNTQRRGLNGDMEYVVVSSSGVVQQTLSLDAAASSSALSWTPAVGITVSLIVGSPSPTLVGATIPATRRYRIDFDTPFDPNLWRLVAYHVNGAYTVDEIVLDWEPVRRGYRGIGLVRGSRG